LLANQPLAKRRQGYKVTLTGPGHNFDRTIDEATAGQILALIMTGAAVPATPSLTAQDMSLASYIKARKAGKKQVMRFLATASWLSSRSNEPLTARAVANALSKHHQKGLTNPGDCLNQNVAKGFCEKRRDGSFVITRRGIRAFE
jgi:hypothetical protein